MDNRLWILGAADPEMEKIEQLLSECGEHYAYALAPGAERVHSGNAYRCDAVRARESTDGAHDCTVYLVECAPPVLGLQYDDPYAGPVVRVDHHRPGDPGYGCPPSEFLSSSSIGQVVALLARRGILPNGWRGWNGHYAMQFQVDPGSFVCAGSKERKGWVVLTWSYGPITIPRGIIFAAAADHCLGAAYRGECPGVDPEALMRWRVLQRAAYQGRPGEEIIADIEAARHALRIAPRVKLGNSVVADLRGQHIAEMPEAAAREGVCFLATVESPDGRTKVVCQVGSPDEIRAFMEQWAPQHGLTGIYGDPERGFAGGYIE